MEWVLFAISIPTVLYIPAVLVLAWRIKRAPRPVTRAWLAQLKCSLDLVCTSLMGVPQGHPASAFGPLNLVCARLLAGLWLWVAQLRAQLETHQSN